MTTHLDTLRAFCNEIERLDKGATPGRWKLWAGQVRWDKGGDSDIGKSVLVADTFYTDDKGKFGRNDAAFIASMRTLGPRAGEVIRMLLPFVECGHFEGQDLDCVRCEALARAAKIISGDKNE